MYIPAQFSPVPCRRRAQLHFPSHSESTGTALLPAGSHAGTCSEFPGSGGGKDSRHIMKLNIRSLDSNSQCEPT